MNVTELVEKALADGLDMEALSAGAVEQRKLQMQAARDEAGVVKACFETPQGRKCLEWLVSKTLLRPPSDDQVGAKSAEEYAIMAARREGQSGLVFMILSALAFERRA